MNAACISERAALETRPRALHSRSPRRRKQPCRSRMEALPSAAGSVLSIQQHHQTAAAVNLKFKQRVLVMCAQR